MAQYKVGKFILHLRKEHGMTQQELANLLNVTDHAVSNWEYGKLDSVTYEIVKYAILKSDNCTQQCNNYQISVEFEI